MGVVGIPALIKLIGGNSPRSSKTDRAGSTMRTYGSGGYGV